MNYGFVRVCAMTPKIKVADVKYNTEEIKILIEEARKKDVKVAVFPELCITGYTCADLFLQSALLESAKQAVLELADFSRDKDMLIVVGIPFVNDCKLYNVAAVIGMGEVLGLVPKMNIPNYSEFYEVRHFISGFKKVKEVKFGDKLIPFGSNMLFRCKNNENFSLAVEICEDLWVPMQPSVNHTIAGATIIANLSASDETTGKEHYRRNLVSSQAARLICGYILSSAGEGESSTDLVFSGHNIITENGVILSESERFMNQSIFTEIDVNKLMAERRRMTTYPDNNGDGENNISNYHVVEFELKDVNNKELIRHIEKAPFVPTNKKEREKRCEEILTIQAMGLKKRLEHTNSRCAVVGISGGLDSTLALLVTVKAFDLLKIDRRGILAVTMPGFGTTDRTYTNALSMIESLGVTLKEINISEAVLRQFEDIGHDKDVKDVTYENSQARQRTLILMNLANEHNGMVIGTGDMSELALGWATYNGDHMSMYGVNASVPKTLVKHLVKYYADSMIDYRLKEVLYDVLDTPVSPELLPPSKDGEILQKTEDLVGPYELHDFYLYNIIRFGYEPRKVFYMATKAFKGEYEEDVILKWLKVFYRRFFTQQFKRSCLPDGVKVGSVTVSPRGDWRMPSDACATLWLEQLENIE